MAYLKDVHTITWADGEIYVYHEKRFIGTLTRQTIGTRTIFMVGGRSYDRLNSAAQELVRRKRGIFLHE